MGDFPTQLESQALSGKSFEASRYMIFMALAEILRRLEKLEALIAKDTDNG